MENEFDGVFRFTNASDDEFTVLWNNKEYKIPGKSRVPMIIPGESLENIQAIRKKWAFKWAEREWYKSERYNQMMELGRKAGGVFPAMDTRELEPYIEMCLNPLPIAKAVVKEGKSQEIRTRGTRPVNDKNNPTAPAADLNQEFKDEPIQALGEQGNNFTV